MAKFKFTRLVPQGNQADTAEFDSCPLFCLPKMYNAKKGSIRLEEVSKTDRSTLYNVYALAGEYSTSEHQLGHLEILSREFIWSKMR